MTEPTDAGTPPALQPRAPRSFLTHMAVDAIVAFLATAIVLYFLGVPLWAMIVIAWALGLVAAPTTRRWEAQQLAARDSEQPD